MPAAEPARRRWGSLGRGARWCAGKAWLGPAGALALLSGCGGGAAQLPREEAACGEASPIAVLPTETEEASGIARDPRRDGLFWVHNDSDNDLVLYGVDREGRLLAAHRVVGGSDRDPEALALARCGDRWCLYLGDIGDNRGLRREIAIDRLPLPPLPPEAERGSTPPPVRGSVEVEASLRLRYPDSPRDAEGLIIDVDRNQVGIVTKGREGTAYLYVAPLEMGAEEPLPLRRVGALRVPMGPSTADLLTDAGLSPDGRHLAVRSYANLFLFRWRGAAAFDGDEEPRASSLLPAAEPQGEGLTFGAEPGVIYLASEGRAGRPPQLSRVRCPSL